ncbi:serine/threonine-protein kinase [Propionibacteriaceae bacterium Y1685]
MSPSNALSIGRYKLDRALGTGAFATVWLGHDPEFDIPVAVKVLADNWAHDADVRERFLAEARHLRTISDPRIVSVHDIGTTNAGQPYFVMDLVTGGTLADFRSHPKYARYALRVGAECCFAVQALHDHGVLHRDIKPGNVLVDWHKDPPRVYLTDLGTAKLLAEASGYTVTTGTPSYMAPEQAHGLDGLDERADVYSLAAMTYELVSGRRPFTVRSPGALLDRRIDEHPAPIAAEAGLPTSLDDLMFRCLATDREERPRSARELADALLMIADDAGEAPPADGWQVPAAPAPARTAITSTSPTSGTSSWSVPSSPSPSRHEPFRHEASRHEAVEPVNTGKAVAQKGPGWPTGLVWLVAVLLFAASAVITWLVIT